jgi:hypothetical protein
MDLVTSAWFRGLMDVMIRQLINYMEQVSSWEVYSSLAGHQIICRLWIPNF